MASAAMNLVKMITAVNALRVAILECDKPFTVPPEIKKALDNVYSVMEEM